MPASPIALRTRSSSQCAIEPGSRTTGSAATIAVISSTDGTVASLSSPAEPSWTGPDDEGDCP